MSKYDFEIDLSMNSSTGLILSKIRPHSVILEFGCATGRMTRYMKEMLGCQVYIVEYDNGAFQKAMEFAQDGICDDIQNYQWLERFGAIDFDAILFADVLEHLKDPEEVLKKAAGLLKADGSVFVSVPNVTHNDIVLKAIEEHFDYSETGLLDNTHIHFWGLENIKTLGKDAGLTVRKLEGTRCTMGDTEQNVQTGKNCLLENILRERAGGEIYQFVLILDKQGNTEPICTIGTAAIDSHIYLDTGSDFNAQEQIAVKSAYSGNGSYVLHYELGVDRAVCRVRLDPVEGQSVVLRRMSICQNGKRLNLMIPNAVAINDGTYLRSDDPMVIAYLEPGEGIVTFDTEFVLPGEQYLGALENAVWADKQAMEQQKHFIQNRLNEFNQEKMILNERIRLKEKLLFQMEQENKQLQTDVNAYIVLVNQKEKYALNLEQQLDMYVSRTHDLQARVEYYQSLKIIKIRTWMGRLLRKIKRCIKWALKRG